MDTVVLAPAGYLIDPDIGSDYERPWRLARGLAQRGLRVVVVAREAKRMGELGPNVEVAYPPGKQPNSPIGRLVDRANLYIHARRIAHREVASGRVLAVHHLGPCSEQSPSLIGRLPVPIVYGPMPGLRPSNVRNDEWSSWLRTPDARAAQVRLSVIAANQARPLAHLLWRRSVRRVDAVTVEARSNIPAWSENCVVIPAGIDVNQFSPDDSDRKVNGRIAAVGSLLARKGYDVLLRAISTMAHNHRSAHLLLIGSGPEEQPLRLLSKQLGIDALVSFVGTLPRADLPRLLQTAEVFCHPAVWDTFPLAPLEAMSCGVPTLVSSAGGLPEMVDGAGLVHSVGDDRQLAEQLSDVLSNSTLRRTLGSAARARVLDHFTWQMMSDSYIDLYRRLSRQSAANVS